MEEESEISRIGQYQKDDSETTVVKRRRVEEILKMERRIPI